MLQASERDPKTRIRCEFPAGSHAGMCFEATLAFCENPLCACESVLLSLFGDSDGEDEPQFRFWVNIGERALDQSDGKLRKADREMGRALVAQLSGEDWVFLWGLYFSEKRRLTDETPDAELKTLFPEMEIEQESMMVGFNEILPYGETVILEVEDRHLVLEEQYCVRTNCGCTELMVTLIDDDRLSVQPDDAGLQFTVLAIDYRTGLWRIASQGSESPVFLERVALLLSGNEYLAGFASRHARLRNLYRLYRQTHHEPIRSGTRKTGRNDPCPCGSGKKYKKCCLPKTATVN